MSLIQAQGLVKYYYETGHEVRVLRGIDLDVHAGDMLAVLGQSGVGKTTLLYLLGALEKPTEGRVLYDGKEVFEDRTEEQLAQFRNRTVGFVFQFHHLIPEFNALENVMMPALVADFPKKQAKELAQEAMAIMGMDHRMDHRPGELSGGEQQRIAVARALVMRPKVVLADEPTGNLDMDTSERLHEQFIRLNEDKGVTFVVVTHNEKLAAQMPRQIRLERGVIVGGGGDAN